MLTSENSTWASVCQAWKRKKGEHMRWIGRTGVQETFHLDAVNLCTNIGNGASLHIVQRFQIISKSEKEFRSF